MKAKALYLFFILISLLNFAGAEQYPTYSGWVNDYARVLSPGTRTTLTQTIEKIEKKTGAEVAVVTLDKIPESESIDSYAVKLFKKWGIGKKGEDNGVLVLVAVRDRKVRIEVGYGLEGILPDGKVGNIIDKKIIPYFKEGDYNKGLISGIIVVGQIIAKDKNVTLDIKSINTEDVFSGKGPFISWFVLVVLVMGLFVLIFFYAPVSLFPGTSSQKRGYWSTGGFGVGGGGGGFGGFGGFGGGFSGGGGASRGW